MGDKSPRNKEKKKKKAENKKSNKNVAAQSATITNLENKIK